MSSGLSTEIGEAHERKAKDQWAEAIDYMQKLPSFDLPGLYRLLSDGKVGCGGETARRFDQVMPPVPYGRHGLGWYLYWLCNSWSKDAYLVLTKHNMVCSPKVFQAWSKTLHAWVLDSYRKSVRCEADIERFDKHRILQYDWLVLNNRPEAAEDLLAMDRTRILTEFVGLPFVRAILTPQTESNLWMLAARRCVPSWRHSSAPPG